MTGKICINIKVTILKQFQIRYETKNSTEPSVRSGREKKLDAYLMSNWFNRFTLMPKTLINLSMYYQMFRVIYGMS